MQCEFISNPSRGTLQILMRRVQDNDIRQILSEKKIDAVALVQGPVTKIIAAADQAEKAADVLVGELNGLCPQHMAAILIAGSVSAVMAATDIVQNM